MGLVEIIIGLCLGVMVVVNRDSRMALYLVLAAFVTAVGIYMMFFYRKYFESNLRKSVEKEYSTNPYFRQEIELHFRPDSFTEETQEGEKTVGYDAVSAVYQYKEMVVLSMEKGSSVLLPVRLFPQEDPKDFVDFIKDRMDQARYGPEDPPPAPDTPSAPDSPSGPDTPDLPSS